MRKGEVAVALVFSLIIGLVGGVQFAGSSTGNQNSFSLNWLEVPNINATYYYLNDVNITDELGGTWGALTATTLDTGQGAYELYAMDQDLETTDGVTFGTVDTGQGANELYDMDQNVLTTSDVLFNDVNVTSDFYLNSNNRTQVLEGDFTGGIGVETDWLDLGGTNRTTWPSGGGGELNGSYSYMIWKSGSTYYLGNGSTQIVDWSTSSLEDVVEAAWGNLTGGGSIYLYGPGEQWLLSGDDIDSQNDNVVIESDWSLRIDCENGTEIQMFHIKNHDNIVLRGLHLWGNRTSQASAGLDSGDRYDGIYAVNTSNLLIDHCWIEEHRHMAIFVWMNSGAEDVGGVTIQNCYLLNNSYNGIGLNRRGGWSKALVFNNVIEGYDDTGVTTYVSNVRIIGNYIKNPVPLTGEGVGGSANWGIAVEGLDTNAGEVKNIVISDNTVEFTKVGIQLSMGSNCWVRGFSITGNTLRNMSTHGMKLGTGHDGVVSANSVMDWDASAGGKYGIELASCVGVKVDGNVLSTQYGAAYGVYLSGTNRWNSITNNDINITSGTGNRGIDLRTDADDTFIDGNIVRSRSYPINIGAGCDRTRVTEDNYWYSTIGNRVNDDGTDTMWPQITAPFVEGTAFVSSAGDPWGWEIDESTEWAVATVHIPNRAHHVIRIKIFAVANVTETHNMTLEVTGEACADNQAFTTESIDIATLNSTSYNFAADDLIYWTIDVDDDADVDDVEGKDSLQIIVIYEAASGGACATDAIFRYIVVEYA